MRDTTLYKNRDEILVAHTLKGNSKALEELIHRYQHWIYNLALRMVWDPLKAEDVTQEILIKIITKLHTFKEKSKFKTWLYRITCNHVINMKKCLKEKKGSVTFSAYWKEIKGLADADFPDTRSYGVETKVLVDEIQYECMLGMLICLKRRQRLAFILGAVFQFQDTLACEIMGIKRDNFRKILSRARKQLYNFMHDKCSLVKPGNPCQCKRKARSLIEAGYINPESLRFNSDFLKKVREIIPEKLNHLLEFYDKKVIELFRDHPFENRPDFNKRLADSIKPSVLLNMFSLD